LTGVETPNFDFRCCAELTSIGWDLSEMVAGEGDGAADDSGFWRMDAAVTLLELGEPIVKLEEVSASSPTLLLFPGVPTSSAAPRSDSKLSRLLYMVLCA